MLWETGEPGTLGRKDIKSVPFVPPLPWGGGSDELVLIGGGGDIFVSIVDEEDWIWALAAANRLASM